MTDKTDKKDILQSMRDFRKRAEDYWHDIYEQAADDIEFCVNKEAQWDAAARLAREKSGRPCITINKIASFVHQQTNALRANKMTLNAIPVDDSDVGRAEIQDAMLEYVLKSSRADIATDWAGGRAIMGGFGFYRVTTDYENELSFNQDIKVKRIENPQSTYLSPEIKCPFGSDSTEAITGEWMSKDEFKRQFPDEEAVSVDDMSEATDWQQEDTVFVAEYYRVEYVQDTLYLLDDGTTLLKSKIDEYEGDPDLVIANERKTQTKTIMWYKCSRDAILEQTEIKADFIPIILVVGDEQWVKNKRYWNSLITNAKDPQIIYNYARTAQLEQLQKAGNRPWVADGESIEGYESYWNDINNPNMTFLPYKSVNEKGQPLAPPFMATAYQGSPDLMREVMTSADEIKGTTNINDATLGNQGNETSGRAIMARQRQSDQGNFHFLDNFKRAYEHLGRVILSMIPHYYDTPRVLRITQDDEVYKTLVINMDPESPLVQKYEKELKDAEVGINGLYNDVTVGKYDIRIAAGADYNTQREEAREVLIELGRAYPALMEVSGDLIIRAFDFPDADKIADRLKMLLPPQLKDDDGDAPPMPPELQQQIQQMQQQMQQAEQALQQMSQELSDKSADRELEVLKEEIKADAMIEAAKIRESGRTDQEEVKAFSSVLQTILDRTADLQQAMAEMQNAPQDWSTQGEDLDSYTSNDEPMQQPQPDMMQEPMPDDMMMPEQGFDEQQPVMPEQMPMGEPMPQDEFEQPMADMPMPDEGML
ncbi:MULTISPECIES: portal protein [unclassified Psychrobacter]|uniref:portal protein n=1 Tax=unclassified Psychrobacter TaxID=196806 RepID=UPI0025EC6915|nr:MULTISPECIES: portal protein [unclassified Psychrobacter]